MNKELQQSMSQFLNLMIEALRKTTDFAAEQIPLYVQELLRYALWDAILGIIFSVAFVVAFLVCAKKANNYLKSDDNYDDFRLTILLGLLVGGLAAIAFVIFTFASVSNIIKITLAPRVYVIDYLKKEIKND